jgi:hypothetical protein
MKGRLKKVIDSPAFSPIAPPSQSLQNGLSHSFDADDFPTTSPSFLKEMDATEEISDDVVQIDQEIKANGKHDKEYFTLSSIFILIHKMQKATNKTTVRRLHFINFSIQWGINHFLLHLLPSKSSKSSLYKFLTLAQKPVPMPKIAKQLKNSCNATDEELERVYQKHLKMCKLAFINKLENNENPTSIITYSILMLLHL